MTRLTRLYITAILLLLGLHASAEVIVLRTGEQKEGQIIFQNEEVVVFKDATGARFQYPKSDVERILSEAPAAKATVETAAAAPSRRVSVGIQLAGGAATMPGVTNGGFASADLVIGTANLLQRQLFLGGGIGYHACFMSGTSASTAPHTYSFLPIYLRGEAPLMRDAKDAPQIGLGVGYGVSLEKSVRGGAYAAIDFGWRHRLTQGRALYLGASAAFQQISLHLPELINQEIYTTETGRCIVQYGVKLTFYL